MSALLELVVMLMFGWVPERPRWATWLVGAVYIVFFGGAIAVALVRLF